MHPRAGLRRRFLSRVAGRGAAPYTAPHMSSDAGSPNPFASIVRPAAVPCFLLSGGLGTRLRGVEARPKALTPVAGIPFIFFLVRSLQIQGYEEVHFLLGHGADEVAGVLGGDLELARFDPRYDRRLGAWLDRVRAGMRFLFHVEESPLGTGGALGRARDHAGDVSLVLNADSFLEIVYEDVIARLALPDRVVPPVTREAPTVGGAPAGLAPPPAPAGLDPPAAPTSPDATAGLVPPVGAALAAVWVPDRGDYGGLDLADDGRVLRFVEKGERNGGWINGGVYALRREVFARLPAGPSSLEKDLLPRLAEEGRLRAHAGRAFFRDIGTPARLKSARAEMGVWVKRMEDGGEL